MKFNFKSSTEFSVSKVPPIVTSMIGVCDKMKDEDLLDVYGISECCHHSAESVKSRSTHPALTPYRHIAGRKLWFGNKKTIIELKKQYPA